MDILILIDRLDDLLYNSKPIPMTEQVRVDRKQVFEILDQMRVTLPEEIKQARWIVKDRREAQATGGHDPRLNQIAASIEELKRSQRSSPPPLTAAAAEQVRSIVEAAETSAARVQQQAAEDAKRLADAAAAHDRDARRKTAVESAAHLGRAEKATDSMVSEAQATSRRINELLASLRGPAEALDRVLNNGASSLKSDFDTLRARLDELEGKKPAGPAAPARPSNGTPGPRVETEVDPLLSDDHGYVSAERLGVGAPALNRPAHRHLQEDQT